MKHRRWVVFSGILWFVIGVSLLYKGLHFISEATFRTETLSFQMVGRVFATPQQAGTFLIAVALITGYLKAKFVLSKTVERVVLRIESLPSPIRFRDAYSRSYWILIGSMILLGMSFRFIPISIDLRGAIDLAIGSALVNGAMLYFRAARLTKSHLYRT
jgi:hypothetical protein